MSLSKQEKEQMKAYMVKAFKMTASRDRATKELGLNRLALALQIPFREGVLFGDIVTDIYQSEQFEYGVAPEYPLDPVAPGTEKNIVAYTIPGEGDLPTKHFEGDYVTVPTYEVGFGISWLARHAMVARWNLLARYLQVMEAGFVKKRNDDGWKTLIAASADRNIIVIDSQAAQGVFTKRLVSNAKVLFTRNGGGNSSSVNRRFMTDLYLSPEMQEEMRNWGLDQVDDVTRREIYLSEDGTGRLSRVFSVNLHPVHELGENQEYQDYYLNDLGASLGSGDVELMIGVNQMTSSSFMHPYREEPTIYPNQLITNFRKAGLEGMADWGFGVFDNRDCILLSC